MKKRVRETARLLAAAVLAISFSGCAKTEAIAPSEASNYLFINEVMTSNSAFAPAADGKCHDWIEIFNAAEAAVDLSDYHLTNNVNLPDLCSLKGFIIPAGGYLLVYASGQDRVDEGGNLHTKFKLSAKGDTVLFSHVSGTVVAQVILPQSPPNVSYGRDQDGAGGYVWFSAPTPGARNSGNQSGDLDALEYTDNGVKISEFMALNEFIDPDDDGDFSSWAELHNPTGKDADLSGYSLTDNIDKPGKWSFPAGTVIPAGGYLRVWCSGKDRKADPANFHTNFKLSDADRQIVLVTNQGRLCSAVDIPFQIPQNISCGFAEGSDELAYFARPTPGAPNTTAAYSLDAPVYPDFNDGVLISETLSVTGSKLDIKIGFIELFNSTDSEVGLSGYTLRTGESADTVFFTFPEINLAAGGYTVVWCSGVTSGAETDRLTCAKKLDIGGTDLYLADETGRIVDFFNTGRQTYGKTCGRVGGDVSTRAVFDRPTPGTANTDVTYAGYAPMPGFSLAGGYVEAGSEVTITVPEGCAVYYTTDGSKPTAESTPYSSGESIMIAQTTVLRAAAVKTGFLPSAVVSETYFAGVRHELPLISVSGDPAGFYGDEGIFVAGPNSSSVSPYTGANYWRKDLEREVAFQYFIADGAEALNMTAGIEIFGGSSRVRAQKSFSLNFRKIYGTNSVTYPFFKDNPVTTTKHLVVRTGWNDTTVDRIADIIAARIVKGLSTLDSMDAQPCVVYINGMYNGLYCLREKIDTDYLRTHQETNPDDVDLIKFQRLAQAGNLKEWQKFMKFVHFHDLSALKNYEYVCSQIDINSLIDWWIIETYLGNSDTGNIRCYKERGNPDSKWRWILYDLDDSMDSRCVNLNNIERMVDSKGHGFVKIDSSLMRKLLENKDFKARFAERYEEMLRTTLATDRLLAIVDEVSGEIRSEIPRQYERWGTPPVEKWEKSVEGIKTFFTNRQKYVLSHLRKTLGIKIEP